MGHFVSSPREREKRDRRDSRGDEREGQGRKRTSVGNQTGKSGLSGKYKSDGILIIQLDNHITGVK